MITCTVCRSANDGKGRSCRICGSALEAGSLLGKALGLFSRGSPDGTAGAVKREPLSLLTALLSRRIMPDGEVLGAIEQSIEEALRKDNPGMDPNTSVKLDPATGKASLHALKTVVESVEHSDRQITVADAQLAQPGANVGDEVAIREPLPAKVSAGAVQAAKRVMLQRLRESERGRKDV